MPWTRPHNWYVCDWGGAWYSTTKTSRTAESSQFSDEWADVLNDVDDMAAQHDFRLPDRGVQPVGLDQADVIDVVPGGRFPQYRAHAGRRLHRHHPAAV